MRKLKDLKNYIALFILVAILGACNKNDKITTVASVEERLSENENTIRYDSNPYEELGIEHNIIMRNYLSIIENNNINIPNYFDERVNSIEIMTNVVYEAYQISGYAPTKSRESIKELFSNLDISIIIGEDINTYFETNFWDRFRTLITEQIIRNSSVNDSVWLTRINNMLYDSCNKVFMNVGENFPVIKPSAIIEKIYEIEDLMLQCNWNPGDYKAFKYIALLKHTSQLWNEILFTNRSFGKATAIDTDINELLGVDKNKEKREQLSSDIQGCALWWGLIVCDMAGGWAGSTSFYTVWGLTGESGLRKKWADNVANGIYPPKY